LEELATEGDHEIQYLVLGVVEDLRGCASKELVAGYFGPKVSQLWGMVSQDLYVPDKVDS
jgi:hypothetical protein